MAVWAPVHTTYWGLLSKPDKQKLASAYPVVSANPSILGAIEPSTTTAGGDLKEPDKQELANAAAHRNSLFLEIETIQKYSPWRMTCVVQNL